MKLREKTRQNAENKQTFGIFLSLNRLIREEGLLCGGSSGASMSCAVEAAKRLQKGQKCVVILPDGVRNYMTKFLNDQWLVDRDIIRVENEQRLW